MSELERYLEVQEKVEQAQEELAHTQGRISQLMEQLKTEFKCKTVDEAKRLLKKTEKEADQLSEKLGNEIDDFETKFGGLIDEFT